MVSRVDLAARGSGADQHSAGRGAEIVDNAVTVVLRSYLLPVDGYCLYDPDDPAAAHRHPSVTYDGIEAATGDVADFLPPVLQQLTIFLARAPSQSGVRCRGAARRRDRGALRQAAIQMSRCCRLAAPAVAAWRRSQPLERQIVIAEGPTAT